MTHNTKGGEASRSDRRQSPTQKALTPEQIKEQVELLKTKIEQPERFCPIFQECQFEEPDSYGRRACELGIRAKLAYERAFGQMLEMMKRPRYTEARLGLLDFSANGVPLACLTQGIVEFAYCELTFDCRKQKSKIDRNIAVKLSKDRDKHSNAASDLDKSLRTVWRSQSMSTEAPLRDELAVSVMISQLCRAHSEIANYARESNQYARFCRQAEEEQVQRLRVLLPPAGPPDRQWWRQISALVHLAFDALSPIPYSPNLLAHTSSENLQTRCKQIGLPDQRGLKQRRHLGRLSMRITDDAISELPLEGAPELRYSPIAEPIIKIARSFLDGTLCIAGENQRLNAYVFEFMQSRRIPEHKPSEHCTICPYRSEKNDTASASEKKERRTP